LELSASTFIAAAELSTSIAAERLLRAPASPPRGEAADGAAAAAGGDRTRYPARDPLAAPGLPWDEEGSSLREEGLRFLAAKNWQGTDPADG
jgi:hypothetical protein